MNNEKEYIIIAKDGFPLEQIINRPITNFFRRLFLSSHRVCRKCYETKNNEKSKVSFYDLQYKDR